MHQENVISQSSFICLSVLLPRFFIFQFCSPESQYTNWGESLEEILQGILIEHLIAHN